MGVVGEDTVVLGKEKRSGMLEEKTLDCFLCLSLVRCFLDLDLTRHQKPPPSPSRTNRKKTAVEKKSAAKLQDARTARKIARLDDRLVAAFAGLTADARVLVNRARIEAQSYRLTMDERPGVEHMTRHIAGIQQKYTQSGGVRPFGISTLIAGFDASEAQRPALYQTDPSGTYSAWRAAAIGRNAKSAREFLEKQLEGTDLSGNGAAKLALRALAETVEVSSATAEVAVLGAKGKELRYLTAEEVDAVVAEVEADKAAADAARRAAGPPEPMA